MPGELEDLRVEGVDAPPADAVQAIRERRNVEGHQDQPWTDFDIDILLERIDRDGVDLAMYRERRKLDEHLSPEAQLRRGMERLAKRSAQEKLEDISSRATKRVAW